MVPVGSYRFCLEEMEPEVSYIDRAELRLTLTDGRQIALKPKDPKLFENDEHYILAYQSAIIEFERPAGVAPDKMVRAELSITGYYRRYKSIVSKLK